MRTRATVTRPSPKERLITAVIVAVVALVVGAVLIVLQTPFGLGLALWLAGGILALAWLTGVDELTDYLAGQCPSCGKPIRAGLKQKQAICPSCKAVVKVITTGNQHEFEA